MTLAAVFSFSLTKRSLNQGDEWLSFSDDIYVASSAPLFAADVRRRMRCPKSSSVRRKSSEKFVRRVVNANTGFHLAHLEQTIFIQAGITFNSYRSLVRI